jgi:hypothetical protein
LFKFDGVRFELFRSPFGDRLQSTNVSSLFASNDGLWVGYVFGGFSFLKKLGAKDRTHAAMIGFKRGIIGM